MAAYVLIEARILDAAAFNEYVSLAQPSVLQYDGRHLAASDDAVALEGVAPTGTYLAEFPSFDRLPNGTHRRNINAHGRWCRGPCRGA